MAPGLGAQRSIRRIPRGCNREASPRSVEPRIGSELGNAAIPPASLKYQISLETLIEYLSQLDTLLAQVPCGRHEPTEFLEHLRRGLPRTSGLELVVLPSFITFVPAGDDVTLETLEVI